MNIIPLGNRLLIEPLPQKTTENIVLPENIRPMFGVPVYSRVLKVGSKIKTVKPGDCVLSHAFDRGAVQVQDSKLRLIDENQVLLIIANREIQ